MARRPQGWGRGGPIWAVVIALGLAWPATSWAARRRPGTARKKAVTAAPMVDDRISAENKLETEEKLRIGREAMESQRFNEAEMAFNSILTFDPRNPDALTGAAEAAFENAHYDQALAWAERAVWEAPTFKNFTLLGHADAKLGLFEQAKVAYAKALSLRPDDPDIREFLRRTEAELALPITERVRLPQR